MKKCLFAFLFIFAAVGVSLSQEAEIYSPNYRFKPGEQARVFGTKIRLRALPSQQAQILAELDMGMGLRILEERPEKERFDGLETPWYKVEAQGKTGYVLGGLLALSALPIGTTTYLVSVAEDSVGFLLKTRLLIEEKRYLERIDRLNTSEFYLSVSGGRGLSGVKSVLEIDYLAESCGVDGGGFLLFHSNGELIKAIEYQQVADGGMYYLIEEVLFPNEEGGRPGGIYFKRKHYELLDEESEWTKEVEMSVFLPWKGQGFIVPE
jgi:hypothetical protein